MTARDKFLIEVFDLICFLRKLLYIAGEPRNDHDFVLNKLLRPEERARLIIPLEPAPVRRERSQAALISCLDTSGKKILRKIQQRKVEKSHGEKCLSSPCTACKLTAFDSRGVFWQQ